MNDIPIRAIVSAKVVATGGEPLPPSEFEVCPDCHALITCGHLGEHAAATHPGRSSRGTA